MTAILTLSCTVKYSPHLKAMLLRLHRVLCTEKDWEEGPGEDIAVLHLNSILRCPESGGG